MSKTELDALDKLQRTDHDTLIRVEAKMDTVVSDIRALKDGNTLILTDHDMRLKLIEKLIEQAQPEIRIKQIDALLEWQHDFKLTWKIILAIASGIGAAATIIINLIFKYLKVI